MSKIGIISGSGAEEIIFAKEFKAVKFNTKYDAVMIKEGWVEGKSVVFINRHGPTYYPPHVINSHGNIQAMKQKEVKRIIATAAVGSMNPRLKPGDFVLLSDFIDFTSARIGYFDPTNFTDVSFPYDEGLRLKIKQAAARLKIKIHPAAVYVCTEGPRFESKAEIKMYRKLGGDVVGMTQVPEVVLAAEACIPYAVIGVVTNYASGINRQRISADEVARKMKEKSRLLSQLL